VTVISAACRSNTRGSVVNLKQQRQTALIDCSSPLCLERSAHPSEHKTTDRKFISCATGYTTDPDRKKQTSRAQRLPIQSHELTHAKNAYACYMSQGQHVAHRHFHYRAIAQTMPSEDVRPSVRPSVRHIRRVVSKQQLNMS